MKIPFLSKLRHGKLVAVFDIGSGSVGGAIVELRGEKPVLIHSSLRSLIPHEERSNEQLAAAISQRTKEVAKKLLEIHTKSKATGKINESLVVMHVPWIRSLTHTLEAALKKESEIVEDMIVQLSRKVQKSDPRKTIEDPFEKSIIRVELNGYPTSSPVGKKAKHISIVVLETEMLGNMKKKITDSLGGFFPGVQPTFRSSTLIDSALMRRRSPQTAHFTIVDVTSEATSLTVVLDGVVVDQKNIPIGYRSVVRAVSKEKNSLEDDVQSRIRMLTKDACSTDDCRLLQDSLDAAGAQFIENFGNAFAEIGKIKRLPNTLMVRCHPDLAGWFTQFFARLDFAQFTETTEPFSVGEISSGATAEYIVFAPGNHPDAGIATSSAFLYTGVGDIVGKLET